MDYRRWTPRLPVSFTTTELKRRTGEVVEAGMREPVGLTKHGRTVAVIVPAQAFAEMGGFLPHQLVFRTRELPLPHVHAIGEAALRPRGTVHVFGRREETIGPGTVMGFPFLSVAEREAGEAEGRKIIPCLVTASYVLGEEEVLTFARLAPGPGEGGASVGIPEIELRRLGLEGPLHADLSETNVESLARRLARVDPDQPRYELSPAALAPILAAWRAELPRTGPGRRAVRTQDIPDDEWAAMVASMTPEAKAELFGDEEGGSAAPATNADADGEGGR